MISSSNKKKKAVTCRQEVLGSKSHDILIVCVCEKFSSPLV